MDFLLQSLSVLRNVFNGEMFMPQDKQLMPFFWFRNGK